MKGSHSILSLVCCLFFIGHLQLPVSKASASCKLQSITPKQLPKDNRELWVSIFIKGLQPNHRWCTPNIWITNNKKSSSEKLPCLKPIFVKDSVSDSAYLRCIPTASGELQVSFSGTRCRLRGSCEGSIELSLCNHADACGVCNGNGSSCMGCDGVPYSSRVIDVYGNCEAGNFSAHQTFVVKLNSLRQKRGLHLLSVNKDLQRLAEQLSLKAYVHPVDAVNSQRGYFHFLGDVIHIDSRSYASLDSLMERQGYEQLIHPVFTEIGVTADRNGFHIIMGSRHRRCGDGIVQRSAGESCDDGNTVSGDGCSSNCSTVESGWICTTTTPRHPTSKCIQLFANDTKSSKQELNTAQQLELEFLQIYLMLADDAHFHGCSYNMSNNSSSRFSTEDWKNIFRLALATAERYLFEGSHNKALLTLKSVHKLCGTDQLVPLSLQWIHNRSVLAFEDSLPDYDMNDHISMVHASSIYDGNNIFTLLHVHPLARGSAFSHKLQLVLCTTADCISNKEQEGGRKISRCSGIQSSINPPLPYLDDTTSPSFNGSKILLVKLQGNQKKAFTVDMTVLDSYQPTGITLIEDDFSAFMTAGGHPSSVPFINTLPIPMKHSSELYVSVVLIQPATAAAYRPVFRLYNVDCNSYIYADSSWSVTVPDPNWRWPLEGIPLRRMQQPGVCAGGTRSGRLCDAPVTCSFGVCKSGRCVGGTSNGRLCDSANEGSLQCPQAQSCYTAEGAYPSFPENPEWYQFPRLSDCSELWCL